MENLEKKRIRFEFMVDDKWKWDAQDKDGTITLFVDKPNLVDERTKIRINDFDSPLDTNKNILHQ